MTKVRIDYKVEKTVGVRKDLKVTARVYYDMGTETFSPARRGGTDEGIEGKLQEQMKR